MKQMKLLILGLSVLGMAACDGLSESGWSDAEKLLLNTYAYSEEVPYADFAGNGELAYDEDYGCLTVKGGTVTAEDLKSYETKVTAAGYSGSYDSDNLYYSYEIDVEDEAGTRYVHLDFYALDAEGSNAESGTFELDIYDPYLYSWSDMSLAAYQEAFFHFGSSAAVPAFSNTGRYGFSSYYLALGINILPVSVYDVDASACEASYQTILEAASWTVTYNSTDKYYDAINADGSLDVQFNYDTDIEALSILIADYNNAGENIAWPSASIATFVNDSSITVPSLTGTIYSAYYNLTYDNYCVYCVDTGTCGTDAVEDAYKAIVVAAGWTCTNDADYTYAEYGYFYQDSTSSIELQFYTFEGYFQLFVALL